MCVILFLASIARPRQFDSVFCGAFNAFWIGVARFLVVLKKQGYHKTCLNRSFLTVACLLKSAQKPWRAVVRSATASWEGGVQILGVANCCRKTLHSFNEKWLYPMLVVKLSPETKLSPEILQHKNGTVTETASAAIDLVLRGHVTNIRTLYAAETY
jgi:hypothetical protein